MRRLYKVRGVWWVESAKGSEHNGFPPINESNADGP